MGLFDNEPALTNHKFPIRGGKTWHLTQDYYDELKETFPLHDIEGDVREAKLWCRVNKRKRKTAKGMTKFLLGWMSRADATGFVTTEPEKSPTEVLRELKIKEYIDSWENVIGEWPVEKLKGRKDFMFACNAYPEFKEWALEKRPDLKK